MNAFVGEIAALLSAALFSLTSICYTFAGRRLSAITSIAISLPISWLILALIHRVTLGEFFPVGASLERWFYLGASGFLAFVVASYFMLDAYQHVGPRLTMLVMSFAPVLGAVLAWLFLGQTLPPNALLGIAVVMFGIVWVVGERGKLRLNTPQQDTRRGLLYAFFATLAQGAAFTFASKGVAGGFPPVSATLIRITAGIVTLWLFVAFQRRIQSTVVVLWQDRRLLLLLIGAALSGQVAAGSLLLLSFQYIAVGVSTTLSHTTAIMLIPVGYFVFKERITLRAIVGTIITIIGIAILFVA